MEVNERDISIIEHISSYCSDIIEATERFGKSIEEFRSDKDYRNACALCILQIGELCGNLSEDFRSRYNEIPWREVKTMRNIVAHRYGRISIEATWETIETDIPELKAFCDRIINSSQEEKEKKNVQE